MSAGICFLLCVTSLLAGMVLGAALAVAGILSGYKNEERKHRK